ncbi:hypothetical protein [Imhoffiella purpurea]|uniref:Uncharacterized protein n=1 Tax=Imhoffiella purpurea TaxID=1249627 RepID=W9VH73_9GAMM|nr:hypothetical protein [Imhoffiella purpurea]EXJ16346.1 hypothetical protein D779_0280 [Imhoffiella purpurea]
MDPSQVASGTLDPRQIFIKSQKGLQEIQTRAFKLPARLRRLLLMVDGRSTLGDLMRRYENLGDDLEDQFQRLVADGFLVERRSARNQDDRNESQVFNLDKAKGFARFVILGALGPAGSHRAERIERCVNPEDLYLEIQDLCDTLPSLLSSRQAKHVLDQLEPLMASLSAHRSDG